eukprot:9840217-Alexandrium_andersonii.AAC.1
MSASLVGSEMCIRDRPSAPQPPGENWPPERHKALLLPGPRSMPSALHAVSYTHLTLPTICSV